MILIATSPLALLRSWSCHWFLQWGELSIRGIHRRGSPRWASMDRKPYLKRYPGLSSTGSARLGLLKRAAGIRGGERREAPVRLTSASSTAST